jgi:hypothetical protein
MHAARAFLPRRFAAAIWLSAACLLGGAGGMGESHAAPAGTAAESPPPRYRAQLPPPMSLSYELRSGYLSGTGELAWQPAVGRYELRLESKVMRLSVLTQVSTGLVDAHGLAPTQFSDRRRRGTPTVASFRRDQGTVTFSGGSAPLPWVPGAQDRLSWMVQLPAVVNADPKRLVPGERWQMYVVGARGDGNLWVFRFTGFESVKTGTGWVRTAKFVRDARKPNDTSAEVWLDPARHYLPARARLATSPDGDSLDLVLRSAVLPS